MNKKHEKQIKDFVDKGLIYKSFLSNKNLDEIINLVLKTKQESRGSYSSTTDDKNNCYVDLVLEGGGVLGIALAGYIFMLESQDIRFASIAGTSAGSIVAMMLPALGKDLYAPKSAALLKLLDEIPMQDFVDGEPEAKSLVKVFQQQSRSLYKLLSRGLRNIWVMQKKWGLNPRDVFEEWLNTKVFKKYKTIGELLNRQQKLIASLQVPDKYLKLRRHEVKHNLVLIVSDVSNKVRVRFPEMAQLYYGAGWQETSPAAMVRASMSVPFFFEPVRIPRKYSGPESWIKTAGLSKDSINNAIKEGRDWLADEAVLVDGGLMSNFPIDVFHSHDSDITLRPTFGVKLEIDPVGKNIKKFSDFAIQQLDAARGVLDKEFIRRNPEYKQLVTFIDTGEHYWLDFDLSREAKQDLFMRGAKAASKFLIKFDWDTYRNQRKDLNHAMRQFKVNVDS